MEFCASTQGWSLFRAPIHHPRYGLTRFCVASILLPSAHRNTRPGRTLMSNISKLFMALCLVAFSASAALAGNDGGGKVKQPKITTQNSGTTQLLIAVSPVNENVVWAAGTGGTYVVTTNGGKTWKSGVVPGADQLQFRDVQGVTDKIAYLLSIGNDPDNFQIYKTVDGGAT